MSELLVAYEARHRREVLEGWRFDTLRWSLTAPYQKSRSRPPKVPQALKEPPHELAGP